MVETSALESTGDPARGSRKIVQALALYLALTIAMTWPLIAHLADATPTYWGDSRLTAWILAWDAHVLGEDPTNLFQAPILHPDRDALAYTEHMFTLGLLGAPVIWATDNPYLAQNVLFLLAVALSAFAAYLLVREIIGDHRAALVGGAAFGFAPYWFGHIINISHIQILASGWIPLAVYAAIRWVRSGKIRPLAILTSAVIFGTLTSWYLGAMLMIAVPLVILITAVASPRPALRKLVINGMLAGIVAVAVLAPFAAPYRRIRDRDPSYTRELADSAAYSATAGSFLSAPAENRMYGNATRSWRERRTSHESDLFPGVATFALALVGVIVARKRQRLGFLIGLGLVGVGVLLSLGVASSGPKRWFPWAWLRALLEPFEGLRAPSRFHVLTILGLALLAGMGARAILARLPIAPSVASACLVIAILLEGTSMPLSLGPAPKPPPIYATLADRPGAILILPTLTHDPASDTVTIYGRSYDFMLYSTAHWRPIVNGVVGYFPPGWLQLIRTIEHFPDAASLSALRERDVRTLVLHTIELAGTPWEGLPLELDGRSDVVLLRSAKDIAVYDIAAD